jgi:hypothetical protein
VEVRCYGRHNAYLHSNGKNNIFACEDPAIVSNFQTYNLFENTEDQYVTMQQIRINHQVSILIRF